VLVVSGAEPAGVSRERHDAVLDEIMAGLRALPGVQRVAGVYRAPLQGPIGLDGWIIVEGDPLSPDSRNLHPPVNAESATPDYFSTMGIRLVAGRAFTPADRFDAPGVVIVSQSLARILWPGQDAVGRRMLSLFRLKPVRSADGQVQWDTVVGVAADVRYRGIERPRFDVYLPVAQADAPAHDIVIRTYGDAASITASVRALIHRIVPASAPDIRTMTSMVAEVTAVWRMTLVILGAFAAFAVALSATGLYGLMAYLVEERTREIGIRIALGAAAWQVQRFIVARTSRLVCVGVIVGLLASVAGSTVLSALLFGVSPTDPVALAAAALMIAGVSLAATYLPMRRAARIDPVVALRAE
jgi:predicted permease